LVLSFDPMEVGASVMRLFNR